MILGERIAAAARGLAGVPFRPHGRSAETGLDCVGLAALAAARGGHVCDPPRHYGLRGGQVDLFRQWLIAAGLRPVRKGKSGDFVLVHVGPAQWHVMVKVPGGHVHAHAGLRRVVEMPGEPPWPVVGVWRAGV